MAVVRVLIGLLAAVGMTGAWMLLAVVVMVISLYIARLVPLGGRRKAQPPNSEI